MQTDRTMMTTQISSTLAGRKIGHLHEGRRRREGVVAAAIAAGQLISTGGAQLIFLALPFSWLACIQQQNYNCN